MKYTYFILSILILVSCSQNNTTQDDSTLKVIDTERTPVFLDTQIVEDFETKKIDLETNNPLKISPLNMSMYDANTKKGKVILNGKSYVLNMQNMNEGYKLYVDNVTISALNGKFEEMVSDCAYGKFADVTITQGTLKLQLHNVSVQDCAGMIE
jgi:hypothetical protein